MSEKDKLERAYALDGLEDVTALYRDWAATYDTDFAEAGGFRMPALIGAAFAELRGEGPVLDAGCGTGLVADHLDPRLAIDGVDISREMLAVARAKGRYRALHEADLTGPLPFADASYRGLVSSGTFTHGHVGPDALHDLLRCLAPGGACAITTNATYMAAVGFHDVLDRLVSEGRIGNLVLREERIYDTPGGAPEGHGEDMGYIVTFLRT